MAEHKPIYPDSRKEAERNGELDDWYASRHENIACRDFISQSISLNYDGYRLGGDVAEQAIAKFGYDRVNLVLANTIQLKDHDGRFSADNKTWAKGFFFADEEAHRREFLIDGSHPGLVDIVAKQARSAYEQLQLFGAEQCISVFEYQDVSDHVLALKPEVLKDEYKSPDFQVFLAERGFGCNPAASGRKIFGQFLIDGEQAHYNREDFLGVLKPEFLPEWAIEKMAQPEPEPEQTPEVARIRIFQINRDRDTERHCFEPLKPGQQVDAAIYDVVYDGPVPNTDPEMIFQQFNVNPPPLHRGWSMSPSDVIEVDGNCHYVNPAGFEQIDFDPALAQKPEGLLRVVMLEPGLPAYEGEIGPGLHSMQQAVRGHIEVSYPLEGNAVAVGNEEAKLIGMEGNRHIGGLLYAGAVFIVGDDGEGGFCSLSEEQAAAYAEQFAQPENISMEEVENDIRMEFHGF
jgi:hypothetical protein